MAAYLIADIDIIDPVGYAEYKAKAPATVASFGGRYLARGGATDILEGTWTPKRCVVIEFPTSTALKTWWSSPEYQPLRKIREQTTVSHLVMTEGI